MFSLRATSSLALSSLVLLLGCARSETSSTSTSSATAGTTSAPTTSTAATTASASKGGCNLISVDELKQITGIDFKDSTLECGFDQVHGSDGGLRITTYGSDMTGMYKNMPGMKKLTDSGIGDQAWWSDTIKNFVALKGSKTVVIGFNYLKADQKTGVEVGKVVVPRL